MNQSDTAHELKLCSYVMHMYTNMSVRLQYLGHDSSDPALECHCLGEFSSNPNQRHLSKLIKVFRDTKYK